MQLKPDQQPPATAITSPHHQPLPLRIISHNIRYAANPFQRFPTEPPWNPTRRQLLARQLLHLTRPRFSPAHTVIFLQEVLHEQFRDVSTALGRSWEGLGVGRDDGKQAGEYEGVWFRREAWKLVGWGTRWLNEDGSVGKRGWDAASVRVATAVVLDARKGDGRGIGEEDEEGEEGHGVRRGRRVLFLNTHFDDQGVVARRESAKLLLSILAELKQRYEPDYWVVGGDLNSPQSDEAYEILASKESGLVDARMVVSNDMVWGEENTYTGFDGEGDVDEGPTRIDFLFVPNSSDGSRKGGVQGYAVTPNTFEDGSDGRVSDHRAVVVDTVVE
ncbi:uncharacterized protein HMPREF1541_05988 [Cyphellophora europaea CBS 101466]|uniref:Endonuclease/exonuclease/phosphatase domain-containing protein n=1 Tax=Cyphellophora europaea (strain CBS 101466) TaxID=1220924 RepID=W2RTI4_CYPE1|nr:uncharacterized protein HMPREF1541_05988 [Cyphellophora europaea CBS 101466]ETN39762.1 hypothetical protein HMPREF1541_05988 [Cyphellophora europaea CBS 101466]